MVHIHHAYMPAHAQMYNALAKHSGMSLTLKAKGDLWIDDHHTADKSQVPLHPYSYRHPMPHAPYPISVLTPRNEGAYSYLSPRSHRTRRLHLAPRSNRL